jgi:transposase
MSSQRYTPEFKDEAVRQVVERGYEVLKLRAQLKRTEEERDKKAAAAKSPTRGI